MNTDPLTASVSLPYPAPEAFDLFTTRFADWWPAEFSWSGADRLERIGIEPRLDGALYEIGPHGLRWDWGRVLGWEPPARIAFSWQIGPDRVPVPDAASATEVSVSFSEIEQITTTVGVEHAGWERHGADGDTYRANFEQAWPYALGRLLELATSDKR